MSAHTGPRRRTIAVLGALFLAVVLSGCGTNSATPQPRATITFIIHNDTRKLVPYVFTGSASVLPASGKLDCLFATRVGTTWDPSWTLVINDKKAVASSDAADLQVGADSRATLTVILVIDASGVRLTNVHPGAPDAGEIPSPLPDQSLGAPPTPPRCQP